LRVVVQELQLGGLGQRLEQLACQVVCRLPKRLDAARRERCGNELAQSRVVGRLEPEQAPALRVPEGLPTWIQRRNADLLRRQHVPEIATEPLVAETTPHVLVSGDEPAI